MNKKIPEQTLRIMDALSGVDEELLERCDRTEKGKEERKGHGRIFRIGFLCAACLCVVLVGRSLKENFLLTEENGMDSGVGLDQEEALPETALTDIVERSGEETVEAEEEAEGIFETGEPEWIDFTKLRDTASIGTEDRKEAKTEGMTECSNLEGDRLYGIPEAAPAELCSGMAEDETDRTGDEEPVQKQMAENWREVCAQSGLERYVPSELPKEYVRQEALAGSGTEGEESLRLSWSDGEHMLWLKLTETDLDPEMKYIWTFPIFNGKADWLEQLPEPGEDGSRRFAVLYGEGVLAEYVGWLTKEEIGELFGGIPGPEEAGP